MIDRRRFLKNLLQGAGLALLAGCDRLSRHETLARVLGSAEGLTRNAQKLITSRRALAKEYPESALSAEFPSNGTREPDTMAYQRHLQNNFADWQLEVGGLTEKSALFSLAELRAMPSRTQITRHDCVEGWSAIGKWKGVPLAELLKRTPPLANARYVVFTCADRYDSGLYYESIDFEEAYHPQTILAYELNDRPLPVPNGAPLRLRVERQLGYKHAKYLMRIDLVETLANIGGGKGGTWEDQGYEWWAGI